MKPTFRKYYYIAYENGWMVRSIDTEGKDDMVMCYTSEDCAKSHAERANEKEPKVYAQKMENYERAMANIHYETLNNYYGVRGRYYGD